MDRLTNDSNIKDVINDDTFAFQCFLKLKQYEDIGLSPEEVIRLKRNDERRLKLLCKAIGIEVKKMDEEQNKGPDNIDRCVKAAKELSERKGKYITYGVYMGLYHDEKPKRRRRIKK